MLRPELRRFPREQLFPAIYEARVLGSVSQGFARNGFVALVSFPINADDAWHAPRYLPRCRPGSRRTGCRAAQRLPSRHAMVTLQSEAAPTRGRVSILLVVKLELGLPTPSVTDPAARTSRAEAPAHAVIATAAARSIWRRQPL
jgi:hypothetical protein